MLPEPIPAPWHQPILRHTPSIARRHGQLREPGTGHTGSAAGTRRVDEGCTAGTVLSVLLLLLQILRYILRYCELPMGQSPGRSDSLSHEKLLIAKRPI